MKRYAISDIHGCAKTFKKLLEKLAFSKQDELYLLGDYIDRGPDSKGVFDHIFYLKEQGYTVHCLRGNHEQLLLASFHDTMDLQIFHRNGGWQTLDSFDARHPRDIPQHYLDFIKDLPHYFEVDNYLMVHAGLDFSKEQPLEDKKGLLWQRDWYGNIDENWLNGRIILHGHTPSRFRNILQSTEALDLLPAINLDNGCVFEHKGYGNLCAFDLDEKRFIFQQNIDRWQRKAPLEKVIFLDINGVMQTGDFRDESIPKDQFGPLFTEACERNLRMLIDSTNAKIVFSSSWRAKGLGVLRAMWIKRRLPGKIIDHTPYYPRTGVFEKRGEEVQDWLDTHDIDRYVIFDNRHEFLDNQLPHFIQTDENEGLTRAAVERAILLLNHGVHGVTLLEEKR